MKKIQFTKMVASGNDFIVIGKRFNQPGISRGGLAQKICDRKYGIGSDGLLILEQSRLADIRMRVFNADGSEAEMCGNGARCVALFRSQVTRHRSYVSIETKAGIIKSEIKAGNVKIKLTDPKDIKLDIPLKLNTRNLKVSFIDTGVPHSVIFVEGIDRVRVDEIGRSVRYHKNFSPRGTNVDFIEVLTKNTIAIRTYERGVEDETLACGTGAAAAALIFALKTDFLGRVSVLTKSKEKLGVYFKKQGSVFSDVWLEGKAGIICKGEYYPSP